MTITLNNKDSASFLERMVLIAVIIIIVLAPNMLYSLAYSLSSRLVFALNIVLMHCPKL